MPHATAYSLAKRALADLIKARPGLADVKVEYQAPESPPDLVGSSGAYDAIWLDRAEGGLSSEVFSGGNLRFDAELVIDVVIQAIRWGSLGTQASVDQRAEELLFEVLAEVGAQHAWDFAQLGLNELEYFWVVPEGVEFEPSYVPGTTAGHACQCRLGLRINARRAF